MFPVGLNSCLLWPSSKYGVWRGILAHKTAEDSVLLPSFPLNCQMSPVPSTITPGLRNVETFSPQFGCVIVPQLTAVVP